MMASRCAVACGDRRLQTLRGPRMRQGLPGTVFAQPAWVLPVNGLHL